MSKEKAVQFAVVLPPTPSFPEAVAYVRRQLKGSPTLVPVFCHQNMPPKEMMADWQKLCSKGREPVLIGVGDFKSPNYVDPAKMTDLGDHTGFNNLLAQSKRLTADEFWRASNLISRFLTDVYFLKEGGDSEAEVFERVLHVANAFLLRQDGRNWDTLLTEERYKKDTAALWRSLGVNEAAIQPFTIQQYFRHLFCSGLDRNEIAEKVGWWISKAKAVDERFKKGKEKLFTPKPFMIQGRGCAAFIQVADYWEARSLHYQWIGSGHLKVAVVRSNAGHVIIHTTAAWVDLSRVFQRLAADEPGRWYLHAPEKGKHVLINGGFRFDKEKPTHWRSADLIRLTQKYTDFVKL